MNKTTFLLGIPKDLAEEEKKTRKRDLFKIKKYLIRQAYSEERFLEKAQHSKS